ncbi:MAG: apolipoprotein N-acyltransferase [Micromonosporaceae bacterium]|nr:apolipoprotein N-acyltransferase [Micromonosporaceae bacterium]
MAPVGVALFALATHRQGFLTSAGLGLITGLSLLLPLLSWAGIVVGSVWLWLPVGESVFFALLGGLSALVSPVVDRRRWAWPVATATLWVLQEALRDRIPFGGFPWGRLAFSQADSPLLGLAAIGGAPLVTAAVGLVGGLVALAVRVALDGRSATVRPSAEGDPPRRATLRAAATALGVAVLVSVAPAPLLWGDPQPGPDTPTVRVAVVQGNVPRLGLDFNAQRRAVLDNHVNATLDLAARVAAGQTPRPDLVVWPENSSDIDPFRYQDAAARISAAARAIGAPILVGGLQDDDDPTKVRNVGIVWDPEHGPTRTYVKRHPVPFAEYVPMRSFIREFITEQVDLVRRDFVAGEAPGVLTMGPATIGDVICFEVAYDEVVRDAVTGGAQVLVVQTNNATFDEAEARQQLAMVRLRAVEHGREALMASTVGVSAFVDRHGTVYDATEFFTQAVIERTIPLSTGRTIATWLGVVPEVVLAAGAVVLVGLALAVRFRRANVRALNDDTAVSEPAAGAAEPTDVTGAPDDPLTPPAPSADGSAGRPEPRPGDALVGGQTTTTKREADE